MYAIVKDGSRQIKVEEGQEVSLDYRSAKAGDEITQLGQPTLDGASVTAEVVGTTQGPKLVVQKFRRRKNSRRKTGHRQLYTKVKINKIQTA